MNRNNSVDLLKLIASFFVICIHTKTWSSIDHFSAGSSSFLIDSIARFAVPFFFVTAGYYAPDNRDKYYKRLKKLAVLCLVWSLVYSGIRFAYDLPYPFFHVTGIAGLDQPLNFLYRLFSYGFERHLWFLPAYIIGLFLLQQLRTERRLMILLAIAFYLTGLCGQGWAFFIVPDRVATILHETYLTRDGFFFAFPCMVAGYQLRSGFIRGSSSLYLLLIPLLFGLQYLEAVCFYRSYHYVSDYTLATLPLAIVLLAFALQSHSLISTGRLATGVYLLHPFWMYVFFIYGKGLFAAAAWPFVYTPLLFLLSLGSAWLLSRLSFTRSLIAS